MADVREVRCWDLNGNRVLDRGEAESLTELILDDLECVRANTTHDHEGR